jgi:MFS family permease
MSVSRRQCGFSPRVLLVIFTACQLANYFDRGVIGGELVAMTRDPVLELEHSEPRQGALQSGFVIGFMLAAPLFAALAHRFAPTKLIAVGLLVWIASSLTAGFAPNYGTLLAARIAIGVGEASFAGLAPAYIDDVAPPHRRNVWLSIFFAATAVGQAAGYGVSGALSAALGWRATFFFETALMAPFVVLFLFVPPPPPTRAPIVAATADAVPGSVANYNALAPPRHRPSVLRQLRDLLENPVYVSISLGYAAWMFVIGCLGVFLPAYCHEHLGLDEAVASLAFGATTVVAGIFGTAAGGYIVDHRKGLTPYQRNVFALRMSSVLILFGGAFCCLGAAVGNAAWSFFLLLFVGEFLIFMTTGPVNAVSLACVQPHDRSMAMSMNILVIHLLGDLPSPVLVGQAMQTVRLLYYPGRDPVTGRLRHEGDQWVITALCTIMFVCAAFWFASSVLYAKLFRERRRDVLLTEAEEADAAAAAVQRDDNGVVALATEADADAEPDADAVALSMR